MPFVNGEHRAYFNGEIYNFHELTPDAHSDGEAILPAYAQWGSDCFKQFDGEFAISIWNGDTSTLLLARDATGAKPLYFSINRERVLWASSASAINRMEPHPFCSDTRSSVYKQTLSVQEPYTSFSGIWLLPPGHFLEVSKYGARLQAYNSWEDASMDRTDVDTLFDVLRQSLESRLSYAGTIGIPLSAGIDSGIIAFTADKLGVPYQVFSVVEMFGEATEESCFIEERIGRLKNATGVTRLACNEREYLDALSTIYSPDYYDSAKFDGGSIPMHTVFQAMHREGIRVAIDGTGGDELFHGYRFRDKFKAVNGWPNPWSKTECFHSLFTSMLDYTAKSDRAGSHFSIETRYPFQSASLVRESFKLRPSEILKWPLRRFLLEQLSYGKATPVDVSGKYGFSLKHRKQRLIVRDMQLAWCRANGLDSLPTAVPAPFPFQIGNRD
jgi:asparagine synthase (glutamine-hydrolysing)